MRAALPFSHFQRSKSRRTRRLYFQRTPSGGLLVVNVSLFACCLLSATALPNICHGYMICIINVCMHTHIHIHLHRNMHICVHVVSSYRMPYPGGVQTA